MDSNKVHIGDIVYLNIEENTLLSNVENLLPYFVVNINKQKNVFRNCLFQILSASPDPISSIVKFSTKHDILVKTSTPVILYNIETKSVLTVAEDSSNKLIFVNKISDRSIFNLSHPEAKKEVGEDLHYNFPINIQNKKNGQYIRLGEAKTPIPSKNLENIPNIGSSFPPIRVKKDTNQIVTEHFEAILKGESDTFQVSLFQSSRSIREDASTILNGDFIRIRYLDKWLSHYPAQENKEEVYFESINDPFRQYNAIHSVFQILDKNLEQANPVAIGENNQYMLKHLVTGSIVHFNSPATVQAYDEVTTTETETPFFNLETECESGLIQEKGPLRIRYSNNQGQETCLKVAESKPVKQVQLEINTTYYFGFKIPEDYSYKNQKNLIRNLAGISTEFEIEGYNIVLEKVSPEELSLIFKIESFFKQLENLLVIAILPGEKNLEQTLKELIISSQEISRLLTLEEEDTKEARSGVTTSKYQLKVPNRKVQALLREFRVFDLIHIINYYFILETSTVLLGGNAGEIGSNYLELYEEFGNLILNGLAENLTNRFYNSQFVRVYINSILERESARLSEVTSNGYARTKKITVKILKSLLWDNDLDALGQINYYIDSLKNCILSDKSYQTHHLELLEHVSNSKASNFVNQYRDTFVTQVFDNPGKVLPAIVLKNSEVFVEFMGATLSLPINILTLSDYSYKYFLAALKAVVAVSSCKMLSFYHNIIKFYPLNTLKEVMKSEVPVEAKMLIHLIVLNVHYAYVKLPFQSHPLSIQANTEQLQNFLNEGNNGSKIASIGPLEQSMLMEQENLKKEIDCIVSNIGDEIISRPISLLMESRKTKATHQKTEIVLQFIEEILNQTTIPNETFSMIEEEIRELIKTTSDDDQNLFSYLPKVLDICNQYYKKSKMQLVLSLYGYIKLGKSEQNLRNTISKFKQNAIENFAPFEILGFNEPKVSASSLSLLNDLSSIEQEVANELNQLIIFSTTEEVERFKKILESNLELQKYNREFISEKENSGSNVVVEYAEYEKIFKILEELFLSIYDPALHFYPHEKSFKQLSAEAKEGCIKEFITSYRKEKSPVRDNPIRIYPPAVSKQLQNVFRLLSIHETLFNILIWGFNFELANAPQQGMNTSYLTRLILGILIAFVYENKKNQIILSTSPPLIKKYYDQSFLDKSTDAMTLFSEIMRDNEVLLELSQKFLYDITCYSFVGTIKPRTFQNGGTYFFATLIAMHFLYKAKLPLSVYDTFNMIEVRLKDLLTSNFGIGIKNKLDYPENYLITHTHIFYSVLEFFRSSAEILKLAKKDGKEAQINKLRNNFSCHKLIEGFSKSEFTFLFDVKNNFLKVLSQLHLSKNNANSNFLNIEDVPSAAKLLYYLLNELLEFLLCSPNNLIKEGTEKLNTEFVQTLERLKGSIIDEEDVNGLFKEVKLEYKTAREKGNLSQRRVQVYMDEHLGFLTLWGDMYIYDSCWKVLAKLCIYYPEVIQVTEIFEIFLAVTMNLINSNKSNTEALRKFKKYLEKIVAMKEYEAHQVKIKGLISLVNSLGGGNLNQPKAEINVNEEVSQNGALAEFIKSLRGTKDQDLEENLKLFSNHIIQNKHRNNIFSQLVTALQLNSFNLPHEDAIFVSKLLALYLRTSLIGKPVQMQKDLVDFDAERRLIDGINVAQDTQNVAELFSVILAFTSGEDLKLLESMQQNLSALKHKLLPSNKELSRYEAHIGFLLEEMCKYAKNLNEKQLGKVLEYFSKSHSLCTSPDNDEFRGMSSLPSGEQVENLKRIFESITEKDIDNLLKSYGPIPITFETISEIFRKDGNDSAFVRELKEGFQRIIKEGNFEKILYDYLHKIALKNQEDLEKVKLDSVLILDLFIGKIKTAILL